MCADITIAQTEQIQNRLHSAISAIHAIQWASRKAQGSDDLDGLLSLLESLIPAVGADLEEVYVAHGGIRAGYFGRGVSRSEGEFHRAARE